MQEQTYVLNLFVQKLSKELFSTSKCKHKDLTNHHIAIGVCCSEHMDKWAASDEVVSKKASQKCPFLVVVKFNIAGVDATVDVLHILIRQIF